jgi:hypothetical protein
MNSPLEDGKHAAVQYEVGTTEPWKGHRIEEEFNKDKNDIDSMQIPFHLQPLTSAHQTKLLHWNLLLDTNHQ